MWLNPPKRLIGGNKQWTTVAHSDNLCVQVSPQGRAHRIFRLVTRRYPNYKLAESYDEETIQQGFTMIAEQLRGLDGKITSKRIAQHVHQLLLQNNKLLSLATYSAAVTDEEEESDFEPTGSPLQDPSESSVSSDDTTPQPTGTPDTIIKHQVKENAPETPLTPPADLHLPLELPISSHHSASLELVETPDEVDMFSNPLEYSTWVDPELMAAFSYFFEGPQLGRSGENNNIKRKRKGDTDKKKDPQSLLDMPFMFISLLTYPDVPQESDSDKAQKIRFAALREIAFVKNRRRMLLGITLYCLFLRFCSFDFFLFALFCTNCGMLYLMKKSGSVNVTMAKRAVRQRITWAKQWTGLLFTRNNADKSGNGNKDKAKSPPATLQRKHTASSLGSVSMLRTNSSPAEIKPPTSPIPSGVNNGGGGRFSSLGRALFRHKSNRGSMSVLPPPPAIPEALKVDTKRGVRNINVTKAPELSPSPKITRSQSEVSLPTLTASLSLDELSQHARLEKSTTAPEVNAATKAAKRISSSF